MFDESAYKELVGDLRGVLERFPKYKPGEKENYAIMADRDQVIARYKPIFSVEHIRELSKEEFTSFLYSDNNHHWSGLYRKGLHAAEDMGQLKAALGVLLDERRPIRMRLNEALPKVAGLGKGIATSILTVAYPDQYGVWNSTSEAALRHYRLWPAPEHGEGIGGRYEKINALLSRLKLDLGIDLWTLDTLWWSLPGPKSNADPAVASESGEEKSGIEVKKVALQKETPLTFISYSRQDELFAMRLAKDLKPSGAPVWLDQLDIKPGQRWDDSVEQALSAASRMLVLLSSFSANSENVKDEVALAFDEKKTVIPIICGDCIIPFRLRRMQYIDFRVDYEGSLRKVVEVLSTAA